MNVDAAAIAAVITRHNFRFDSERELQDQLASLFPAARREVVLSGGDRVDFVLDRIGLEVKVGGSGSALIRQLHRYAAAEVIDELLVVSASRRLAAQLPAEIDGKRVVCVVVGLGL